MQILARCAANASKVLDVLRVVTYINVAQIKTPHPVEVAAIVGTMVMMTALQMVSFLVHPHGDCGIDDLILMQNFCKLEKISIGVILHSNM